MVSAFSRVLSRYFVLCVLLSPCLSFAQGTNRFLPRDFSGWKIEPQSIKTAADPASVDTTDGAVLSEYGFLDSEIGTYSRNGRKMQIKAARFKDSTGAYGAFSYYVQPRMRAETVGDKAASNNARILFYKGNILVDASLEHVTAMSGADLRSLADALPHPQGNTAALPTLPGNLPAQSQLPNTSRYLIGPEALARLGVPIPPQLVDFSKSPEIVMAQYRTSAGQATLTIIGYPTPQMAREKLPQLQAASLPGGPFYFKRTGPFVAVINGAISADEAQSLLASVNYDADITWNQATKPRPQEDRAGFIVALVLLCVLVVLAAAIFGFAFGGLRLLLSKLYPNKVFNHSDSADIIRLDLK